ncbi:hypothetical protein HAHE_43170 [Haloferula helveola]|uniref:Lipoprotein n=1 Tax=Haloferula helveola TaxID=490095 RepID=A0ABN6HDQ0_9BACT|nr:hypothetical protein HAHE_43170 [Haloferula helveola]
MRLLLPTLLVAGLSSCGTMNTIKDGTVAGFSKVGEGMSNGFDKVAEVTTSPFRPGVPVVEARQDEWEELQSGHDRALAYQAEQRRRRGFWIFGGSVDFEEPELPDSGGGVMDTGLLPPKD